MEHMLQLHQTGGGHAVPGSGYATQVPFGGSACLAPRPRQFARRAPALGGRLAPAFRGADEITLTPLLIQDTMTIEQSKMISSQRTVEDIMPQTTIISKRINQVSFGKRTATSPTKGI